MELVLLKNRPLNTVLIDEKDNVRYRTQTPFRLAKRTTTIIRCSDRINDTYTDNNNDASFTDSDAPHNMTVIGQIHWRWLIGSSRLYYNGMDMSFYDYLTGRDILCV
jgi:hypothetical protein